MQKSLQGRISIWLFSFEQNECRYIYLSDKIIMIHHALTSMIFAYQILYTLYLQSGSTAESVGNSQVKEVRILFVLKSVICDNVYEAEFCNRLRWICSLLENYLILFFLLRLNIVIVIIIIIYYTSFSKGSWMRVNYPKPVVHSHTFLSFPGDPEINLLNVSCGPPCHNCKLEHW